MSTTLHLSARDDDDPPRSYEIADRIEKFIGAGKALHTLTLNGVALGESGASAVVTALQSTAGASASGVFGCPLRTLRASGCALGSRGSTPLCATPTAS